MFKKIMNRIRNWQYRRALKKYNELPLALTIPRDKYGRFLFVDTTVKDTNCKCNCDC